jgi:hypothetical protein
MSTLTKQLIKQATQITNENSGNWGVAYSNFNPEKFAELLLDECYKALWTPECATSDLAAEEYVRNTKRIITHFGVTQ